MQKLLLSCVLALACTGCSGFAHLTHQLVVHAPEVAAWGGLAYAGKAGLDLVNTADQTAHRVEKRLDP